ncbi:MAG: MarR family transcriptional regulator [Crocinitomicaceae bacterium]|jgi:DNA-binding MarR family transcriptional regulator|nr:MarR family transcriptional regulator [Crocinitomicaceae bacterium]
MENKSELEGRFQSETHKAIVNIRVASNIIGARFSKFMSEFDLSMAQFNILRILRGAKEPLTINTVKERMIEKSPNTTRLIDKLLEKGLIKKFQCMDDRRQTYLHITEAGLELLKTIDERTDFPSQTLCNISEAESKTLNDLLDKVKESFL